MPYTVCMFPGRSPALCGAILSSLLLAGCGGGPTGATPTPTPTPSAPAVAFPTGIYALQAMDGAPDNDLLQNPDISGIAVRTRWATLEVKPGEYDWGYLDAQIGAARAAGKRISVYIAGTPAWLFGEGANSFIAKDGTIPVPWDPVFLDRWTRFIRAFGARYADEPVIAYTRGSTESVTDGWSLEAFGKTGFSWKGAGYTPEKLLSAMQTVVDAFLTSMPRTHHWAEVAAIPFEKELSGKATTYVAGEIARYGAATYPGRFGVWRENLSGCVPFPPDKSDGQWSLLLQFPGEAGAQMLWNVQDGPKRMNQCGLRPNDKAAVLGSAVNRGLDYKMGYLEIYKVDVEDPSLRAVMSAAASMLAQE